MVYTKRSQGSNLEVPTFAKSVGCSRVMPEDTSHMTKKHSLCREHRHKNSPGVFHVKMLNTSRQLLMFLSGFQNFPSKDKVATAVQWEKCVYFLRHMPVISIIYLNVTGVNQC